MPLSRRPPAGTAVALLLVLAMVGCAAERAAAASTADLPAARLVAAPMPGPLQEWAIPDLAVTPLPASQATSQADFELVGTNGRQLYAQRMNDLEQGTHFVRFDTDTGAVAAEYRFRKPPKATPYLDGAKWAMNPAGVVLLDGDRKTAAVLDPETLAVRRRVPLPKNTRSSLPANRQHPGPVWVGHPANDYDSLRGRYTRRAVTRIDVNAARATTTRKVPGCGTKGGVQPTPKLLVVPVECSYQLALIDLPTGKTQQVPAFQKRAELALIGGEVWARWGELGYLAKLDPDTGTLRTIDLNAGGPLLRDLYNLVPGAGSVWAVGTPAVDSPVRVVFRIDPETVTVTGRAWGEGSVAFIGDTGYTWDEQGRLSSFDPASVNRARPTELVRPEVTSARAHEPRNATERAIISTFSRVFDYRVSNAKAAPYLENARQLMPVRSKLTKLARTLYESLALIITEVSVSGDEASLAYTFVLNGAPAFVPLVGSLERKDGKWIVSEASVCELAVTAGVAQC